MGVGRRGRVHRRDGRQASARHRRRSCTCAKAKTSCCPASSALDHPQVLRPHHVADPHEEGEVGRGQEGERARPTRTRQVNQARRCGRGRSARSRKSSTRSSTSTSRTTSSRRWPGRTRKVEGNRNTRSCSTCPRARRSICGTATQRRGIKLYVRRVFIMDDAEQLLPVYLRFVRGVSTRTTCRSTSRARSCSSRATSKRSGGVGQARARPARRPGGEREGEVRDVLEGVRPRAQGRPGRGHRQPGAHRQAAALCIDARRTPTSRVSLADYVGRMKEGQEEIYYVTADSFAAAQNSPHLEVFRKKGIEVLLLVGPRGRVGRQPPAPNSRASAGSRSRRAISTSASSTTKRKQEQREGGRGATSRSDRAHQEVASASGQGCSRHEPARGLAGLPGGRRARHGREPSAHSEGRRSERTGARSRSWRSIAASAGAAIKDEETRFRRLALVLFDQAMLADGGQLADRRLRAAAQSADAHDESVNERSVYGLTARGPTGRCASPCTRDVRTRPRSSCGCPRWKTGAPPCACTRWRDRSTHGRCPC